MQMLVVMPFIAVDRGIDFIEWGKRYYSSNLATSSAIPSVTLRTIKQRKVLRRVEVELDAL